MTPLNGISVGTQTTTNKNEPPDAKKVKQYVENYLNRSAYLRRVETNEPNTMKYVTGDNNYDPTSFFKVLNVKTVTFKLGENTSDGKFEMIMPDETDPNYEYYSPMEINNNGDIFMNGIPSGNMFNQKSE